MDRYLIVTPANPAYNGTTLHVQFKDGRAVVDAHTLPQKPGVKLTLDQLIWKFQHDVDGFVVRKLPNAPLDADETLFEANVQLDPAEGGKALFEMAEAEAAKPTKAAVPKGQSARRGSNKR